MRSFNYRLKKRPEACIRFHSLQASFFVTPVISLAVASTDSNLEAHQEHSTVAGLGVNKTPPENSRFSGHAACFVACMRHARGKERQTPIPAGPPRRFLTPWAWVALGAAARGSVARLHGFPRGFVPFFSTLFRELHSTRPG